MKQKKSVWKVILSTILFWVIIFLGPFLLVLWNDLSLIRYDRGSLGFLFFATIVQGIAAVIAWYAASHVLDGACCLSAAVNCIVCATFLVLMIFATTDTVQGIVSNVVAIVALIVGAVACFQGHDERKRKEAKKLEAKFENLLTDAEKWKDFDPHK